MPTPAQREYSDIPPWRDPGTVGMLAVLGWRVERVYIERAPHMAIAKNPQFPDFEMWMYHPVGREFRCGRHIEKQRYFSFVPRRIRTGRGVNFLSVEKAHRDVLRRTI